MKRCDFLREQFLSALYTTWMLGSRTKNPIVPSDNSGAEEVEKSRQYLSGSRHNSDRLGRVTSSNKVRCILPIAVSDGP